MHKPNLSWIKNESTHRLEDLRDTLDFCLRQAELDKLTGILIEYFLISYGCNEMERSVLRQRFLIPQLSQQDGLFTHSRLSETKKLVFVERLDQHIHGEIDQEIYIRKLFAFAYSRRAKRSLASVFLPVGYGKEESRFLHVDINYLRSAKAVFNEIQLPFNNSGIKKITLLSQVKDNEVDINKFIDYLHMSLRIQSSLMLTLVFLGALNILPPIIILPLMAVLISFNQYRYQSFSNDHHKFNDTFSAIPDSKKFSDLLEDVIESFLRETEESINLIQAEKKIKNDKLENFQQAVSTDIIVNRNIETSSSSSHNDDLKHKIALKFPAQFASRKNVDKINATDVTSGNSDISWLVGATTIKYNPAVYSEKTIELWTMKTGMLYLNGIYYIDWNKEEIKKSIQQVRKDYQPVYNEFCKIGQMGHIVTFEGNSGYVYCKGQNEDYIIKLKSLQEYARYRLFFKPISKSDSGKLLLGAPSFSLEH
jgi:hypothetical protein